MAAITTGGSGNWSSTAPNAPWPGGVLPTAADDVTIANGHTVTVDVTTAVANSVTVAGGGTLQPSTSANSKLTVQQGITTAATASPVSNLLYDLSAFPAIKAELRLANVGAASGAGYLLSIQGNFILRGAAKTPYTYTQGALTANSSTSVVVDDATGWRVGDKLVFATTQAYNAVPRVDVVTIATITPGSGTTATITWTDGAGTGGAVAYDHANRCLVGNFTRNVIVGPASPYNVVCVELPTASRASNGRVDHVMFDRCKVTTGYPYGVLRINGASTLQSVSNNAFFDYVGQNSPSCGYWFTNSLGSAPVRQNNLFFADTATETAAIAHAGQSYEIGPEVSPVLFRAKRGILINWPGSRVDAPLISGVVSSIGGGVEPDVNNSDGAVIGGGIWSCNKAVNCAQGTNAAPPLFDGVRLGIGPNSDAVYDAPNAFDLRPRANHSVIFRSCPEHAAGFKSEPKNVDSAQVRLYNRNGDTAVQEVYQISSETIPSKARDATTFTRSTSALRMRWIGTGNYVRSESFEILSKSGAPVKLICYVRRNAAYGTATLPKITVSGLGITPVVAQMSSGTPADTWEKLELTATQNSGSDGLLRVTLEGQSANDGAQCWFSGLPIPPFVSRCRHYGYQFDETNPTRTVNITTAVDEATAAAYTGISVAWGASQSDVTISADRTFQQLYDYTQAQSCLNVGSAVPLTGAGTAGNPALFAAGNITIATTKKLNGSGSLAMGAFTLSTEFSSGASPAYTYTGGTWRQASTVPDFDGGTLTIGAAGTYTFTAKSTIIVFTPTAPGTYVLADGTFSGTLDLRNASAAHAITVELPAGTAYTTANNTGAAITVTTPSVYQSVTISGAVAGSRIQIYDTTAGVELYNGTPTFPFTWTDPNPAVANRAIRLRVAYYGAGAPGVAKHFIEQAIGTCGTTAATAAVSYLVNQVNDTVYINNGLDGATYYGSDVTFTDASTDLVNINVTGGNYTWAKIYAAFVYYRFTEAGIRSDIAYIDAPDTANYLLTSMKLKNISSPEVPLIVTGGWGRDASSGSSKDIIDTSGGDIYLAPDHVVPYATGSGLSGSQAAQLADAASYSALAATESTLARKLLRNKRVLDTATGIETVYDDNGAVLFTRAVYSDKDGTTLYNGTQPPHRVERYT